MSLHWVDNDDVSWCDGEHDAFLAMKQFLSIGKCCRASARILGIGWNNIEIALRQDCFKWTKYVHMYVEKNSQTIF